ncbi:MAG: transposase [Magnetococcus sp. THC-1_WYH]
MAKASDLTPEQRVEVVLSLLRRDEPASILARRYGISTNTLSQWREEFLAGGANNLASGNHQKRAEATRLAELEAAVEERDRVIGEITIANRILKKKADALPLMTNSGKK